MVAFTHFFPGNVMEPQGVKLEVEGRLVEVLLQGKMIGLEGPEKFAKDTDVINGMNCWRAEVMTGSSDLVKILSDGSDGNVRIDLDGLTPGIFLVVESHWICTRLHSPA